MTMDMATLSADLLIGDALALLQDPATSRDDKAALYAVLHQWQLRVNRVLRGAKDDLIIGMERDGLRDLGPLSIKATSIDPAWPCNDEGNWDDDNVQEHMAVLSLIAPDYIRHVPDHFEIRTAELGAGIAAGDPVARELHNECKRRGWRTEQGRRLSLAVREVRVPPKKEAA